MPNNIHLTGRLLLETSIYVKIKNILISKREKMTLFFSQYLDKASDFVFSMIPTPDLIRLGSQYKPSESNLKERQSILMALFSRYGNKMDIFYQTMYLNTPSNISLFKETLSNHSFLLSLKQCLKSPYSDIAHQLALANASYGIPGTPILLNSFNQTLANHYRKIEETKQIKATLNAELAKFERSSEWDKDRYISSLIEKGYPNSQKIKLLLPYIGEEHTRILVKKLLSRLTSEQSKSASYQTPDWRRLLSLLNTISLIDHQMLDVTDIDQLIWFAHQMINRHNISSGYYAYDVAMTLWKLIPNNEKPTVILFLSEKIQSQAPSADLLNIICMPKLITQPSDQEQFFSHIQHCLTDLNNQQLSLAAFFAAITFSLDIDPQRFDYFIERAIDASLSRPIQNELQCIEHILPNLNREQLDFVAIKLLVRLKEMTDNQQPPTSSHFMRWDEQCARILGSYILHHPISEEFKTLLNDENSSSPMFHALQQLPRLSQWLDDHARETNTAEQGFKHSA